MVLWVVAGEAREVVDAEVDAAAEEEKEEEKEDVLLWRWWWWSSSSLVVSLSLSCIMRLRPRSCNCASCCSRLESARSDSASTDVLDAAWLSLSRLSLSALESCRPQREPMMPLGPCGDESDRAEGGLAIGVEERLFVGKGGQERRARCVGDVSSIAACLLYTENIEMYSMVE